MGRNALRSGPIVLIQVETALYYGRIGSYDLHQVAPGGPMIRSELVQKVADENPGLTPREIEAIISTFFDQIVDRLAADGRVELRGFGAFSTRARDARTGRNPRTGEVVDVDAKRVPYFKPGKDMRVRLNV